MTPLSRHTSLPLHLSPITPLSHRTSLPSHLSHHTSPNFPHLHTPLPSNLSNHTFPNLSPQTLAATARRTTDSSHQWQPVTWTSDLPPPTNPPPLPDLPSELEESPTPSEASVVLQSITTDTAPEIPAAAAAPAAATVTAAVTAAAVGVGKAAGVRDCCACIQFVTSTVAITTVVVAVGLVQWLWWGSSRCLCLCGVCVRACVCCGCI